MITAVFGPEILARSLSKPAVRDRHGNEWQYHSRSDRHSKIACWGILFDLLQRSKVLKDQISKGEVSFGINHQMVDFKQNRKKDLDLVLCTPGSPNGGSKKKVSFASLVDKHGIELSPKEQKKLGAFPDLEVTSVGAVRMALEAKAAMTAHVRALPRLFDELNSSHLTIHGSTDSAIAVGFAMINIANEFVSPGKNPWPLGRMPTEISIHKQPADAKRVLGKIEELPRRTKQGEVGYDAIAAVMVDCKNDGSPVSLVKTRPAPKAGEILHYASMIERIAELYDGRYGR